MKISHRRFHFFAYREWAQKIYFNVAVYPFDNKGMLFTVKDQQNPPKEAVVVDPKNLTEITKNFKKDKDVLLFYGWSWIVPKEITDNFICYCLHPSPLPKYRGGSPIQNQIMAGETQSAVTVFRMTEGLDDGPIFRQQPISLEGNIEQILERITKEGVLITSRLIEATQNNVLSFRPQDDSQATFCKRRKEKDNEILPTDSAKVIYDKVRSLGYPYPNAYFVAADGKKVYITKAELET